MMRWEARGDVQKVRVFEIYFAHGRSYDLKNVVRLSGARGEAGCTMLEISVSLEGHC